MAIAASERSGGERVDANLSGYGRYARGDGNDRDILDNVVLQGTAAVPEPGTLVLFAIAGVFLLLSYLWQRRKVATSEPSFLSVSCRVPPVLRQASSLSDFEY